MSTKSSPTEKAAMVSTHGNSPSNLNSLNGPALKSRGRPPLGQGQTVRIGATVPEWMETLAQSYSEKNGQAFSYVVREAFIEYFERRGLLDLTAFPKTVA